MDNVQLDTVSILISVRSYKRCVKCYHLKTQLLNAGNIENSIFFKNDVVNKMIYDYGFARVYWCELGKLSKDIIVYEAHLKKLKVCEMFEGDE